MEDKIPEDELTIEKETDEETVAINYDIASYPSDFTLTGIAQMWDDQDIEFPDYQREFVWSIQQASLLIDSFLVDFLYRQYFSMLMSTIRILLLTDNKES